MSKIASFFLIALFLSVSIGCKKGEGEGGRATIMGKVHVREYNANFSLLYGEYDGQAEDVYIVYGDNDTYNDNVETHYDGTFKFEWLRTGSYELYVYSKDTTMNEPSGVVPIIVEVEITDKDQVIDVGTITIAD